MGSVPKKKVCQPVLTAPRLIFFPLHFFSTTHGVNPFQHSPEKGKFTDFCSSAIFVSISSLHSNAPCMIQPLLTQLSGAARFKCKQRWGLKRCLMHFCILAGLLVILPLDNRSLHGATQRGHPQWQSPANLLSETNLFDMAVHKILPWIKK